MLLGLLFLIKHESNRYTHKQLFQKRELWDQIKTYIQKPAQSFTECRKHVWLFVAFDLHLSKLPWGFYTCYQICDKIASMPFLRNYVAHHTCKMYSLSLNPTSLHPFYHILLGKLASFQFHTIQFHTRLSSVHSLGTCHVYLNHLTFHSFQGYFCHFLGFTQVSFPPNSSKTTELNMPSCVLTGYQFAFPIAVFCIPCVWFSLF